MEPEPVPLTAALAAHQLLQRGLLFRGSEYGLASPSQNTWQDGPVGIVRPAGPDGPERTWIVVPGANLLPDLGAETYDPLRRGLAMALAVDGLPAADQLALLETQLRVPVVAFNAGREAAGGPAAVQTGALAEVHGTLSYPEHELARMDCQAAYQRLDADHDVHRFHRALAAETPRTWLTEGIAGLCIVLWFVQITTGIDAGSPSGVQMLPWGASTTGLSSGSQPWRLLTAGFLHFGLVHLAINMWILWELGRFCERLFGRPAYAAVYLASIVGGFVASMSWNIHGIAAGASGGIFGLAGSILGFMLLRRDTIPRPVFTRLAKPIGIFIAANLFLTMFLSIAFPIDNAGHMGGLVTGFLAGAALSRPLPPQPRVWSRFALVTGALVLVLAGVWLGARQLPSVARERAFAPVQEVVFEYRDLAYRAYKLPDQADAEQAQDLRKEIDALRERVPALENDDARTPQVRTALTRVLELLSHWVEAKERGDPTEVQRWEQALPEGLEALERALEP